MKIDIILGLLRHVLTLVGGYYVSKGQIDQSSVDTVIGAVTSVAGVAWSVKHKLG
jgi:hypothetical protein